MTFGLSGEVTNEVFLRIFDPDSVLRTVTLNLFLTESGRGRDPGERGAD